MAGVLDRFRQKKIRASEASAPEESSKSAEGKKPAKKHVKDTKKKETPKDSKKESKEESTTSELSIGKERSLTDGERKRILEIVRAPHLTEKALTQASEQNVYVFDVSDRAGKKNVALAIEALYGVNVEHVRVIRSKSKKRVFRGRKGTTTGSKKAMVKVQDGQSIELFEQTV